MAVLDRGHAEPSCITAIMRGAGTVPARSGPAPNDPEPDHLAGRCETFHRQGGERPVEVLVVVVAVVVLRVVLDGCLNARRTADSISRYLEARHGPDWLVRRDRRQR